MQERFALGEIDKEIYEKVGGKLKQEKTAIEQENENAEIKLSNLEKYTDYTSKQSSYILFSCSLQGCKLLNIKYCCLHSIFSATTYRSFIKNELESD